ncbi:hypothetical protein N2384_05725 [Bacillus paralicheniformis]|uniref:hypothetical protein n=1 Tax=Bacillus paralicheniformis TaxID=1648923 RepID=UPI0021A82A70|nr:hypothetical protein [Bacillus paralicheniformis]UWS62556.1 hypothetical protein N2384_05725 [Bacillus paralicheniformis]
MSGMLQRLGLHDTMPMAQLNDRQRLAAGYKIGFGSPRLYQAPDYRGNTPAGYLVANGLTGCIGYRSEKTRSYDGNTTANYANRKTVQPLEKRPSTPNDSDIATPDYSAKGNSLERKQFARQELLLNLLV